MRFPDDESTAHDQYYAVEDRVEHHTNSKETLKLAHELTELVGLQQGLAQVYAFYELDSEKYPLIRTVEQSALQRAQAIDDALKKLNSLERDQFYKESGTSPDTTEYTILIFSSTMSTEMSEQNIRRLLHDSKPLLKIIEGFGYISGQYGFHELQEAVFPLEWSADDRSYRELRIAQNEGDNSQSELKYDALYKRPPLTSNEFSQMRALLKEVTLWHYARIQGMNDGTASARARVLKFARVISAQYHHQVVQAVQHNRAAMSFVEQFTKIRFLSFQQFPAIQQLDKAITNSSQFDDDDKRQLKELLQVWQDVTTEVTDHAERYSIATGTTATLEQLAKIQKTNYLLGKAGLLLNARAFKKEQVSGPFLSDEDEITLSIQLRTFNDLFVQLKELWSE